MEAISTNFPSKDTAPKPCRAFSNPMDPVSWRLEKNPISLDPNPTKTCCFSIARITQLENHDPFWLAKVIAFLSYHCIIVDVFPCMMYIRIHPIPSKNPSLSLCFLHGLQDTLGRFLGSPPTPLRDFDTRINPKKLQKLRGHPGD